jgi:adenylyltransferase/sulfurtransferase
LTQGKYSRQELFARIGREGQARLLASSVVIVGCGALGTAQANALTRAGVGRVRIIDRDFVDTSNLQRQILFDESDAADSLPKAVAAERKLKQVNADVQVEGVVADLDASNAERLLCGYDVILDGTDNFETRYLLNDAAVMLGTAWIYGAVVGSLATTMSVVPGCSACLACVFPDHPKGLHETCDTVGVIAPAAAWATAIQITEALKILLGRAHELHGMLLSYDVWTNRLAQVRLRRDPDCAVCVQRRFAHLENRALSHSILCGRDSVQIHDQRPRAIDLAELRNRLKSLGEVRGNAYLLRCTLHPYELTVFSDGRALIKGTADPAVARGIYAKYVGS